VDYYVHAVKFGYFEGAFGRDTPQASEGRRIALAAGEWFDQARVTLWRPAAVSGTILDEAGEPVVGAIVRVLPQIVLAGIPRVVAGPSTTTDDRGRYRIGGLTPGRYVISLPSVQSAVPAATSIYTLMRTTPAGFEAAERVGRAPVLPPMVSADKATSVVVDQYPQAAGNRGPVRVYPPAFYPSARTIGAASLVEVNYGEDRDGLDIVLRPEPVARVSGRVIGPGEAWGGLVLRLVPVGSESLGFGAETATALVGDDGAFTLLNVPAGEYTLLAMRSVLEIHQALDGSNLNTAMSPPPGFASTSSGAGTIPSAPPGTGYNFSSAPGPNTHWGRTSVVVGAQDVAGLTLELKPTVAIRGHIDWQGIKPAITVAGAAGGPSGPAAIPIYADPADGDVSLGMPSGRSVLSTGAFEIVGLRSGLYRLRIIGAPAVQSIVWDGRDYTDRPFDASEGRDIEGVVVRLTSQLATASGDVRDDRGNRVVTGAVLAFPVNRALWLHQGFAPAKLRSAPVGSDGRYELKLPAGEYHIVAVTDAQAAGWQDPKFLERAAAGAPVVRLEWGATSAQSLTQRTLR
jgi:hypothetical protein